MRRVVLGAGVAALAVIAFLAVRHEGNRTAQATLDQALGNLPAGYTATHGKAEIDAIDGGMVVRDFAMSHHGAPLWSANRIVVSGADQQALRDVFDPAAYPAGHPAWTERRKLLSHFEADGLVIQDTDPKAPPLHIKRLSLDGLSGRPFLMAPTSENRVKREFLEDAALALAAASVSAENAGGGTEAPNGRMDIGSLSLTDYDSGRLGQAEIKDVTYSRSGAAGANNAVSSTIARLAAGQIDARAWLILVQQASQDQQAGLTTVQVGAIDIGATRIVQPGGPLVSMDSLHVANTYRADGTSSGAMAIRAMTIARHEAPPDANSQMMVQVLGADSLVLDVDLAGNSDQKGRRAVIDRYDFDLHGLGTLRLSGTLSDLPAGDRFGVDMTAPLKLAALMQSRVERARVAWEDRGLANRLLAFAAQRAGTTPEALRAKLAVPLAASLAVMLPDQPDAADQVGAFLRDPKMLAITVAPPLPVSLAEAAQAPATQRAHLLGLSVKGD